MEIKRKKHWGKALLSFLLVLLTMPLGHAVMILMEHFIGRGAPALHYAAFLMGFAGLLMVIIGVFVKGDTRQTLLGFFGGLLFWTGWVEFLFMYYANRYGTQPQMVDGVVVTKPEYLILPATFGFWMMFMLLYLFSARSGCNFMNWCQRALFRGHKNEIVARPMTRHTSIVTFMELNMILWTSYLLLMFCYDPNFIGDDSPVTLLVGGICFIGAFFIFRKQLYLPSWGANIRMAIATVIVFWTPVEILGRLNFFEEVWIEPLKYRGVMLTVLFCFLVLVGYVAVSAFMKKKAVPK